jgi:hypothetical protein
MECVIDDFENIIEKACKISFKSRCPKLRACQYMEQKGKYEIAIRKAKCTSWKNY